MVICISTYITPDDLIAGERLFSSYKKNIKDHPEREQFSVSLRQLTFNYIISGKYPSKMDIARALDMNPDTFDKYLAAGTNYRLDTIIRFAEFFNTDCDFLLRGVRTEYRGYQEIGLSQNSIDFLKKAKKTDYFNTIEKFLSDEGITFFRQAHSLEADASTLEDTLSASDYLIDNMKSINQPGQSSPTVSANTDTHYDYLASCQPDEYLDAVGDALKEAHRNLKISFFYFSRSAEESARKLFNLDALEKEAKRVAGTLRDTMDNLSHK